MNKERTLVVALYVDNLLLFSPTPEKIRPLKQALSEAFEMKDLGEARLVLGISVTRNRDAKTIIIDQEHYIKDMLKEHGLDAGRTVATLTNSYANLRVREPDEPATNIKAYQSLIGKLNWLV